MKQFVVTRYALGRQHECPISMESFQAAKAAFVTLNEALLLEERFDAIAGGFLEFEKAMLAKMLEFSYAGFKDGLHQISVRRDLNRTSMNALSAARAYIDHLPQTCSSVFGTEDERKLACQLSLRNSYDQFLGYRMFEALRNHSQHSGFPIQSVAYAHQGEGQPPCARSRLTISPIADVEVLEQNEKFKKSVLAEMKTLGSRIDLKPHFREYMSGIAKAHYIFRSHATSILEAANATLNELLRLFASSGGDENHLGLHAIEKDGKLFIESIPLGTGIYTYCDYLARNNSSFDQLGDFYIASAGRDA
jgi:hypothetical protein